MLTNVILHVFASAKFSIIFVKTVIGVKCFFFFSPEVSQAFEMKLQQ